MIYLLVEVRRRSCSVFLGYPVFCKSYNCKICLECVHRRRGEVVQGETRQSYVAAGNSPEVPAGSIPGPLPRPTCHWPGSGKWFNAISQPAGGCMLWSPPTLSSQESDMSQKKTMKRISIPKSEKRKLDSRDRVGGFRDSLWSVSPRTWTTMSPTIVSRPSLRGNKLDVAVEFCLCAKVGIKCEYDFDPTNPYSRCFKELVALFLVSNSEESFICV